MGVTTVPTGIIRVVSPATTERGRKTRQRILETAADIFHRNGVNATSVDEVLKAAGAGKSQFYHYFKNKDDLVRKVIRYHLDSLFTDEASCWRFDSWEYLDSFLKNVSQQQPDHGCPLGRMVLELGEGNSPLRRELNGVFSRLQARMSDGFRSMKKNGLLNRQADPESLALFVLASMQGGLLLGKVSRDNGRIQQVLDHTRRHLGSFAKKK